MFLPPLIVGNEILDLLQKLSWPKNLAISDFSVSPWKLAMLLLQIIATIVALRSQSCNSIGNKRHFLLQIWTSKRSIGAWCHKKWALSQVMSRQVLRSVPICLKNFLTMKHFFLICNLESDYWTQRAHIKHILSLAYLARQLWLSGVSLKRSIKMQFRRVELGSIWPPSQKLWGAVHIYYVTQIWGPERLPSWNFVLNWEDPRPSFTSQLWERSSLQSWCQQYIYFV